MKTRPEILLHPNIPKPLHGISPRVVKGKAWWDEVRQKAYQSTNFKCLACGISKHEAQFHYWLEAHELYEYDWEKGRLEMKEIVPLCHACHNYIHSGRMKVLLNSGLMSEDKYNSILTRGDELIRHLPWPSQTQTGPSWEDWRMVIDGKEYGPSSDSFEDWQDGAWRNWKP